MIKIDIFKNKFLLYGLFCFVLFLFPLIVDDPFYLNKMSTYICFVFTGRLPRKSEKYVWSGCRAKLRVCVPQIPHKFVPPNVAPPVVVPVAV